MLNKKKEHPKEKTRLHPRNKHRGRYDFKQLIGSCPELKQFVKLNDYNDESIDFFKPEAVIMLNKALLKYYYHINNWDIPSGYLCPPIPGRADYIHYVADLLGSRNENEIPTGNQVKVLDIGVGANCVYPIIGHQEYGWSFVGTDIDYISIESANSIVEQNPELKGNIEIRLQNNIEDIFRGIIRNGERFDLTICNPPFHASKAEAEKGTHRKLKNLKQEKTTETILNFGGQQAELWCQGGELEFVQKMVSQSKQFSNCCFWFSTLISKESNLRKIYQALKKVEVSEKLTIQMGQGNKTSRIVAWTFLSKEQQKEWRNEFNEIYQGINKCITTIML